MRRPLIGTVLSVGALVAAASSAEAAERHAAPGGTGPEPCATVAPCSLATAIGGGGVAAGDTVTLASGDYDHPSATPIGVWSPGLTIVGPAPGAAPATITFSGGGYLIVMALDVRVRDLTIIGLDAEGWLLNGQQPGMQVDRVRIEGRGTSYGGLLVSPGSTVRDSTVWSPDMGIGFRASAGQTGPIHLVNVTAAAQRLPVIANGAAVNATGAVDARLTNTLLHRWDPIAGGAGLHVSRSAGNGPVSVTSEYSVIPSVQVVGTGIATAGAGVLPSALLADPAGRDLRQADGSPSIDGGALVVPGGLGAFDVAGRPRTIGSRPDIGAHEFGAIPVDPGPGGGGGAGDGGGGGGAGEARPPVSSPSTPLPRQHPAVPTLRNLRSHRRTLLVRTSTAGRVTFRVDRCRVRRTRLASGRIRTREACRRVATLRVDAPGPGTVRRTVPRGLRAGRYRVTAHQKATSGNQATSVRKVRIARR